MKNTRAGKCRNLSEALLRRMWRNAVFKYLFGKGLGGVLGAYTWGISSSHVVYPLGLGGLCIFSYHCHTHIFRIIVVLAQTFLYRILFKFVYNCSCLSASAQVIPMHFQ